MLYIGRKQEKFSFFNCYIFVNTLFNHLQDHIAFALIENLEKRVKTFTFYLLLHPLPNDSLGES